jgi:Protein of unknown function (DUF4065)
MTYTAPQTKVPKARFWFQIKKSIEASARILDMHSKDPKKIECVSLLRMLYLCDENSLDQTDRTISGGCYVVTENGLVSGSVHALIQGKASDSEQALWDKYFYCKEDYVCLKLGEHPGKGNLCPKDEEIIDKVYRSYENTPPHNARSWTKNTPAWEPDMTEVSVEDILKKLRKDDESILMIQEMDLLAQYLEEV